MGTGRHLLCCLVGPVDLKQKPSLTRLPAAVTLVGAGFLRAFNLIATRSRNVARRLRRTTVISCISTLQLFHLVSDVTALPTVNPSRDPQSAWGRQSTGERDVFTMESSSRIGYCRNRELLE